MTPLTGIKLHTLKGGIFPCLIASCLRECVIGSLLSDPRVRSLGRALVNPDADLGRSRSQRRSRATSLYGRVFYAYAVCYGGCAWDTFGCAGFLCDRSANPCTVAPRRCLAATGDGSNHKGALPMRNPTQCVSAPRHYLFSVVAPSHHQAATITAESPQKAMSAFAGWFAVPTSDVAISRRQPVLEVVNG